MGSNNSESLFVPSDSPYGRTFLDWAKEWWKWDYSISKSAHPQLDHSRTDPEKCANQNQSANVWFLPNFDSSQKPNYTFTCTVPQGKAIIVGNLNQGESDYGITPGDAETRDAATRGQIGASLQVWLDGVNQNYSMKYMRVTSDFFNLTFVKNNIVDGPEGIYRAMIDGYYIFLKPLSQGTHHLHFESKVENNPKPSLNFAQGGNWIFNVK